MIPQRTLIGTIEISTGDFTVTTQPPLYQGENGALYVQVGLLMNGSSYSPSGVTAEMYMYFPNSTRMTPVQQMGISGSNLYGSISDDLTGIDGYPLLIIQLLDSSSSALIVAAAHRLHISGTKGSQLVSVKYPTQDQVLDAATALQEATAKLASIRAIQTSAEETANSALQAAQNAVQTANSAAENASSAVQTANSASQQASGAAQTASSASSAANSAVQSANSALETANAAAENASSAVETANGASRNASNAVQTAGAAAENASNALETANEALETANAAQSKSNTALSRSAEAVSSSASATNISYQVQNELAETQNVITEQDNRITDLESDSDDIIVGWEWIDEENAIVGFVNKNGERVGEPLSVGRGTGGGGGGDTSTAVLTFENLSGWASTGIAKGETCTIQLQWSSIDDEVPTGNGTLSILVGTTTKAVLDVAQGTLSIELSQYLSAGTNKVTLRIEDSYGQAKRKVVNVTVYDLYLESPFDPSTPYTGSFNFPYTPYGAVAKTIYFQIDNETPATVQTSLSNRQLNYMVAAQSHGVHTLRCWFTAVINGSTVTTSVLQYEFMSVDEESTVPIISTQFFTSAVDQYSTVVVPTRVYDPSALSTELKIYVNNILQNTLTVDRTEHRYSFRLDNAGSNTITFTVGSVSKSLSITVRELELDIETVTEDLLYHFSSYGRSNDEANPTVVDGATLTGFNGVSDLWQLDDDGVTALKIKGGAGVEFNITPFANDIRSTGYTISFGFATSEMRDFDAVLFSCLSGGRGLVVTGSSATLISEQSQVSVSFRENAHIDLAFVVRKRSGVRLLELYVDAIRSAVTAYPDDDDFQQVTPVKLTAGSAYGTIDLYNIRIYSADLTAEQIVNNWVLDTQNGATMYARYTKNNVYDAYGNIDLSKIAGQLPYKIIKGTLPTYKGDKQTVDIEFVDPINPERSFTSTGVQIDVQGTSSAVYRRKNYKYKHKNGFVMTQSGNTAAKFALADGIKAVSTFCDKADVASSEGANNVELVKLYEEICPYKTPAQIEDATVRQGIYGFPIVIFHQVSGVNSFLGKYNFNLDKSTSESYGFVEGDESWEVKNNTSNRVLYKSADYTGDDWLTDFEARYPDTDPAYVDKAQLEEFAAWIVQTDTTAATGNALSSPITYDGVEYTADTAAYRLAKFKAEVGNYVELQSALFYYLFTDFFLMIDSRAKNMFPSFMGTIIN